MFETIIRNGLLMTVAALILAVLGVLAATRVPVQMIPDLEVRTVTVQTRWPGATPQDIEKEILIEQEEYLRTIPNLQRLQASASRGSARIELEFPFGTDMTDTLIRVNNALNQVPSYPINVDEPRVFASSFSSNSFMFFHVSPLDGNPRGLDMDMMRDFIEDNVRTRMSNVPGVSAVQVWGGAERQIRVVVDPVRLADRGIGITDVRDAIRQRNRDVSGGEIDTGKRRYLLRTVGRFDDVQQLEGLILERRGDTLIRLGEVADIVFDHFEINSLSFVDGDPVINLAVRRETGSNVIDIKYAMFAAVERIDKEVLAPAGMEIKLIAEDVAYVEASVRNVWTNLGIGAVLATLVMYLFLRSGRATAVGVIGIPLCTIAAFIGLLATGRTINVISLAGIAFAIGMTLDNSIVVIESIELARRRGKERFESAVEGVRNVWPAVLASTLTTILVFAPVLFIREEAGQLYSDIAIAISASILASMLVAITLIPTAAARLKFGTEARHGPTAEHGGPIVEMVDWLIAEPRRRMVTIVSTVGLSLAVIVLLTPAAEYLPEGEEPKTFASLNAPPGYNLATMTRRRRPRALRTGRDGRAGDQVPQRAHHAGRHAHYRGGRRLRAYQRPDGRYHPQVQGVPGHAGVRGARLHHYQQRWRHAQHQPGHLRPEPGGHLRRRAGRLPPRRGGLRESAHPLASVDAGAGATAGRGSSRLGAGIGTRHGRRQRRLHGGRAH
jgi:multidrug efflux pump subunit AcrB